MRSQKAHIQDDTSLRPRPLHFVNRSMLVAVDIDEIEDSDLGKGTEQVSSKKCNKRQRERLDIYTRQECHFRYMEMLDLASRKFGRHIGDLGELTMVEASLLEGYLRENKRR